MQLYTNFGGSSMKLYQHQLKAIKNMKNGCILCGGVGTGKSITSLAYFLTKVCNGSIEVKENDDIDYIPPTVMRELYIITTARKRDTFEWEKELNRWGLSSNEEKFREINSTNVKIVIDSWNNVSKYDKVRGAFFIFDEQRVVGYGKWARSFIRIAKLNKWILLSATPGDTWNDYMAVFIANGFYANKTDFYNQHVIMKWNQQYGFPKIERYVDLDILIKHRDDILVDMKYDKITIPHHIYVECDYDKKMYDKVRNERIDIFNMSPVDGKPEPLDDIAAVIRVLRKIVGESQSRVNELSKIIDDKKKVIVFYNFNYERYILRNFCESNGLTYAEWNGDKHQALPEGDEWVYLVQYTAGAEGWNCVTCNTIVFYSQSYSYKQTLQACGRIDRLNTTYSDLYYYHFTSKSSIDYMMKKTLDRKEEFNEKKAANGIFFDEEEDPFASRYSQKEEINYGIA